MCHDSTYAWQTSRRRTRTFWNKILLPAAEVGVIFGEYLYSYSFVLSVLVIVVREVIGGEEERPPTTTAYKTQHRSIEAAAKPEDPSICLLPPEFCSFFHYTTPHHTALHYCLNTSSTPIFFNIKNGIQSNSSQAKQIRSDQIKSNQTKTQINSNNEIENENKNRMLRSLNAISRNVRTTGVKNSAWRSFSSTEDYDVVVVGK